MYEKSCGSAIENEMSTSVCNEGCFCPDGTINHNGKCIRVEDCPCTLRGKTFKAGKEIKKDCNTCKCEKGVWKCSDLTCGARCGAIGDPHYQTFDGKHFDFMGKCSYYLLKTDDGLEITAENVACPGGCLQCLSLILIKSMAFSFNINPCDNNNSDLIRVCFQIINNPKFENRIPLT